MCGVTAIRVWAPDVSSIQVRAGGTDVALSASGDGWWSGPDLAPGTDYAFLLDVRADLSTGDEAVADRVLA